MIFDVFENAAVLKAISTEFAAAAEWLEQNAGNLDALPPGRIEILPAKDSSDCLPDIYVNVEDTVLRPTDEALFERHRRYADIQVVVSGPEAFEVSLGTLSSKVLYSETKDIEFLSGAADLRGILIPGQFVVYRAGEAHKPALRQVPDRPETIRKIVIKVRER